MLWDAHERRRRFLEAARLEEAARNDLVAAYSLIAGANPAAALEKTALADEKIGKILGLLESDRHSLAWVSSLMAAEANFILGGGERLDTAEREFDRAIRLMRHSGGAAWELALVGRGRVRLELGKHRLAEEDFTTLLSFNPNYGAAYYWRSRAREALGNAEEAERDASRSKCLGSWPPAKDFKHLYAEASPPWGP